MAKIYVGDLGTVIRADVGQDTTGATGITIEVKKPDGTLVTWPADMTLSDTFKIEHIIAAGDLDIPGTYTCQAKLTIGSWSGRGDTFSFVVYSAYK